MKNFPTYFRQSLFTLLNGNVMYNATPVPVYENGGKAKLPMQINVMDYSDANASNKNKFCALGSQVVEIIAYQETEARMYVDQVGELVMNLIKPTTRSELLTGSDIQVQLRGKPSTNYITTTSAEGKNFIVRLILRYNFKISEQL